MEIVISPDPILREVCEPVENVDRSIKHLAKQMAKDMYKNNGCGLAAPQVGVTKRLIVLDCNLDENAKKEPITLINPEITAHGDETWASSEGCLSVPGITCDIERFCNVTVHYLDIDGAECDVTADKDENSLLCCCLQHEIDHLDGVTMFERLGPIERIDALKRYQEALEAGAQPGDTSVE